MIGLGVKLEGLEILMRHIAEMGQRVDDQTVEKALKAGGEFLKDKLEPEIPDRTGNWKENIIVSEVKNGVVEVGADQQSNAFYGHMYEFGTSKQPARPVYGPVYENYKGETEEKMVEVIKEELGL